MENLGNNGVEVLKNVNSTWIKDNEEFFGVPVCDIKDDYFVIEDKLREFIDNRWNSKRKKDWPTVRKLLQDRYGKDVNATFDITFNFICYSVYATTDHFSDKNIMTIPVVYNYGNWMIGSSLNSPRGIARRNRTSLTKIDNIVFYPGKWQYNCDTDTVSGFEAKIIDKETGKKKTIIYPENIDFSASCLSGDDMSLLYMKTFCPKFTTTEGEEKFRKHLQELPNTTYNSVINYFYTDYHYFFTKVEEEIANYNPNSTKIISINKVISANGRKNTEAADTEEIGSFLTLNVDKNNIFSIGNVRSCILDQKKPARNFQFTNCAPFFDAFKVSTNKNAGSFRLLLDDVKIENGLLYKLIDGKWLNQFEVFKKYYVDGEKYDGVSLSVLSNSDFNEKDGPKRIMMTGKAYGQAIPIVGEDDPIHHIIHARALFSDFYGYTIGDGIVISESFAEKIRSDHNEFIVVSSTLEDIIRKYYDLDNDKEIKDCYLDVEDFIKLKDKKVLKFERYENIHIVKCSVIKGKFYLNISYFVSAQPGDKLTNLHGAKGVISLILPDSEMPSLKEDFGDMKAGPIEVIISSYGIIDRRNLGQIYEAYHNCGTDRSAKNLIEFRGKTYDKAFGMLSMLRLCHINIGHASFSAVNGKSYEQINLGEMELNALSIQDNQELMNEMSRRSNRNSGRPEDYIYGNISSVSPDTNMFLNILKCLGYMFKVEDEDEDGDNGEESILTSDEEEINIVL